ncbi:Methylesterase 1 [Cardamine amara subsp. amara]|uniref:Methylesterase 1 n=1 Tax=Cardamine amara subsp. amara TaxID=228776 RepID=A0ABD1BC24_CARAN
MSEEKITKQHFVLVHGPCHGAWCWYKALPLLEAKGHRVTAVDLAASGRDMTKSITDVLTCEQYSEPLTNLMASLPREEKVVLVCHSTGGLPVAIAMEKFPKKVSVAVFVTAFMPDTKHSPAFVVEKFDNSVPREAWMDTVFKPYGPDNSGLSLLLGREFMKLVIYELSPIEDLELATLLKRPGSFFINALSKMENFSDEAYGSVPRAYIVVKNDKGIPEEYQRWMIDNFPVNLVVEMEKTDHLPMLSSPKQLCDHILKIAHNFV